MITLKTKNYTQTELEKLHKLIACADLEKIIPCPETGCRECKHKRLCEDWTSIYKHSYNLAKVPFDI